MIVLFTDFGIEGPYIGQLKRVIYQYHPAATIIDLFSDLPPCQPQGASTLLAAYSEGFPENAVFLAVVDPGVGMPQRRGIVARANGYWFVGPDNGLFGRVLKRDSESQWWEITWQPESLSDSFHGRDLFAPIAAEIAAGRFPDDKLKLLESPLPDGVDDDYPCIVYVDRFGNLITGVRAQRLGHASVITLAGEQIRYARTFGEAGEGEIFWYNNSNGLVEIATNRASASQLLGVTVGEPISFES